MSPFFYACFGLEPRGRFWKAQKELSTFPFEPALRNPHLPPTCMAHPSGRSTVWQRRPHTAAACITGGGVARFAKRKEHRVLCMHDGARHTNIRQVLYLRPRMGCTRDEGRMMRAWSRESMLCLREGGVSLRIRSVLDFFLFLFARLLN